MGGVLTGATGSLIKNGSADLTLAFNEAATCASSNVTLTVT